MSDRKEAGRVPPEQKLGQKPRVEIGLLARDTHLPQPLASFGDAGVDRNDGTRPQETAVASFSFSDW